MKLSLPVILLALGASVQAECYIQAGFGTVGDKKCCWGGQEGTDACLRQTKAQSCIQGVVHVPNFCKNVGIPTTQCDSDCCDIETGRGQPCPKGKNRCDSETGCPYRTFPEGKLM